MSECGSFGNWFLQSIQLSQEVEKRSYVAVYQLKIMRLTADNKLQSGKCKHDTCTVRIVSYLNLLLKKRRKKSNSQFKMYFFKKQHHPIQGRLKIENHFYQYITLQHKQERNQTKEWNPKRLWFYFKKENKNKNKMKLWYNPACWFLPL